MSVSRVELWVDIMYKIHTLTRANKESLESINELISHISEGRPIMAIQDDEQLEVVSRAVKDLMEEEEEETEVMH